MSFKGAIGRLEKNFDAAGYLSKFEPTKGDEENWQIECPDCGKRKLYVLVKERDGKPPGTHICFSGDCGYAGGPLSLVRRMEDLDFLQGLETLREYSVGADREKDLRKAMIAAFSALPEPEATAADDEQEEALPETFEPVRMGRKRPRYFTERGVSYRAAVYYGLGWCPGGYYANRLIVPVRKKGRLSWFLGRWMGPGAPPNGKKYLNSAASHASRTLYGFDQARGIKRAIVVEDVFSKICLGKSALATFGTQFSRKQFELLGQLDVDEVVLCWDRDAIDKAWDLAEKIDEVVKTRVAELPDARDPDELGREATLRVVDRAQSFSSSSSLRGAVASRLDHEPFVARRLRPA